MRLSLFCPIATVGLATVALGQDHDHIITLGFAHTAGPVTPAPSGPNAWPAARIKDNNRDGNVSVDEIHTFMKMSFSQNNNGSFITDIRSVEEDGEIAFYICDQGDGSIVRGVDDNHNGVLDNNELTEIFDFGWSSCTRSPKAIAVHRDTAVNRTIIYTISDSGSSSCAIPNGIFRLEDINGNGVIDSGEQTVFVDASMGITVPGTMGPVTLATDEWQSVRVTPSGKVLAYCSGFFVSGPSFSITNPDAYCWYEFTDVSGTATNAGVFFNASTLNDLPQHPDFAMGTFPNWDIEWTDSNGTTQRWTDYVLMDTDFGGGPNGEDAYYFHASYYTGGSRRDVNINGNPVGGLIYRFLDTNGNETIDAGELTLYCNISSMAHAGVSSISVTAPMGVPVTRFAAPTRDIGAATGRVHMYWDNGSDDSVITMADTNANGFIDQGEANVPYIVGQTAGLYVPPFDPNRGPYTMGGMSPADALMPGPFMTGITPYGDGCATGSRGLIPVADSYGGAPQVGNGSFQLAVLRAIPGLPTFMVGGTVQLSAPLGGFGLPGCFSLTDGAATAGPINADAAGRAFFNVPIPASPSLVGGPPFFFQFALFDTVPPAGGGLPIYTSNGLQIAIQP